MKTTTIRIDYETIELLKSISLKIAGKESVSLAIRLLARKWKKENGEDNE